jgi:Integrase core domain
MVDSGATHHITPYQPDFTSWALAMGTVSLGGHAKIVQIGSGKVVTKLTGGDRGVQLTLHDVMHIPEAQSRYFLVSTLLHKGGSILFKNMGFEISMQGHSVAKGYMEDNLFWFDSAHAALNIANPVSHPIDIWHQHMGHMSYNTLMQYSDSVNGILLSTPLATDQLPCAGCELSKQSRLPFSALPKCLVHQLQLIHSNLAGPMQIHSIQKALYIATFIDDYSRHGVVYFLKSKDQCFATFKTFVAWAENQTSERVLALRLDRRGEYMSDDLKAFLAKKGIEHQLTMPTSPQQNCLAEQWNRTILDKAHTSLHGAGLSLSFWELAVDATVHTYNRTPTHVLEWKTPHELWSGGHVPDVSYFCVFGCKAYVHMPKDDQQKLDPLSIEMMLVGYEPGSKGYWLWNPKK